MEYQADRLYTSTAFARQPIFTADNKVWGCELRYRGKTDDESAQYSDEDVATLSVIAGSLMDYAPDANNTRRTLIHFGEAAILKSIPLALEPECTGILIRPVASPGRNYLDALSGFKRMGYKLVLNNYTGEDISEELLGLCDVVFIDFLSQSPDVIAGLVLAGRCHGALLGAKRIEDRASFEAASAMGIELFQGFYFQKPEIVPGRSISASALSRLAIFKVITLPDPDIDELTRLLQADVSLSYRFLRFVNSAAFGLKNVDSIRHALLLIGWSRLKSWLWLMVLTDINPPNKPSELPFLSAVRGRFMEVSVRFSPSTHLNPDSLFLLGLFSLLDAMLDRPFEEIVKALPIESDIKDALCGRKNAYENWLLMASCFETGDWKLLDALVDRLGLQPSRVAGAYCEAANWTRSFFRLDSAGSGIRPDQNSAASEDPETGGGEGQGVQNTQEGVMLYDPMQESIFARLVAYVRGVLR